MSIKLGNPNCLTAISRLHWFMFSKYEVVHPIWIAISPPLMNSRWHSMPLFQRTYACLSNAYALSWLWNSYKTSSLQPPLIFPNLPLSLREHSHFLILELLCVKFFLYSMFFPLRSHLNVRSLFILRFLKSDLVVTTTKPLSFPTKWAHANRSCRVSNIYEAQRRLTII